MYILEPFPAYVLYTSLYEPLWWLTQEPLVSPYDIVAIEHRTKRLILLLFLLIAKLLAWPREATIQYDLDLRLPSTLSQ